MRRRGRGDKDKEEECGEDRRREGTVDGAMEDGGAEGGGGEEENLNAATATPAVTVEAKEKEISFSSKKEEKEISFSLRKREKEISYYSRRFTSP